MASIFFQPAQELKRVLPLAQNRLTKAKVRMLGLRDQSLRTPITKCGVELFRLDARFAMHFFMRWELLWRSDLLDQTGLWQEYNELYDGLSSLESDIAWLNDTLAREDNKRLDVAEPSFSGKANDAKKKETNIASLDVKMPPKIEPGMHASTPFAAPSVPATITSGRAGQRDKRGRFHFGVHRMFTTA